MLSLEKNFKHAVKRMGYEIRHVDETCAIHHGALIRDFRERSAAIEVRHWQQTRETVTILRKKYEKPILGKMKIWDLLNLLGQCIDPSDLALAGVSQLTHALQVAEGMSKDGITDSDFLIAALIHDLGKILLLTDEVPENIVGMNTPIGEYEAGIGLDNCFFQWNHDEFIYSRLKDRLPDHLSWLIRYHGILIPQSEPFMNERDKLYLKCSS